MNNDERKKMQNDIFNSTKIALKGKSVTKKIIPLGAGVDDQKWTIEGSEKNVFVFHTSEFGKKVHALTIFATAKKVNSESVLKETFSSDDFVKKMHCLFKNKELEIFKKNINKAQKKFVEQFKSNIK